MVSLWFGQCGKAYRKLKVNASFLSNFGKIILACSGGGLRLLLLPLAAWTNSRHAVKQCCFIQQPLCYASVF